jgi:hypothetical protein
MRFYLLCSAICRAICDLVSLGGPKLGNVLRDGFVESGLKLWAVPEGEENLHPDKEGRKEQSLDKVIEECRSSTLEDAVADELSQM